MVYKGIQKTFASKLVVELTQIAPPMRNAVEVNLFREQGNAKDSVLEVLVLRVHPVELKTIERYVHAIHH